MTVPWRSVDSRGTCHLTKYPSAVRRRKPSATRLSSATAVCCGVLPSRDGARAGDRHDGDPLSSPLSLRSGRPDRHQEAARLGELEGAGAPLRIVRFGVEFDPRRFRTLCNRVDVLCCLDEETNADALLTIAALLPIVLAQTDARFTRAQHHTLQHAAVFPALFDAESKAFEELEALL